MNCGQQASNKYDPYRDWEWHNIVVFCQRQCETFFLRKKLLKNKRKKSYKPKTKMSITKLEKQPNWTKQQKRKVVKREIVKIFSI